MTHLLLYMYIIYHISTHTSLAGRDLSSSAVSCRPRGFLLTRPSRDVTFRVRLFLACLAFLLTRPSRDVTLIRCGTHGPQKFLLTRPSRDVTLMDDGNTVTFKFLLTRPSRDVTPAFVPLFTLPPISTHTSLAGRDFHPSSVFRDSKYFYSHVPRGT